MLISCFPNTPHDAQYHLNRLFHVTRSCGRKKAFQTLNPAELFVLAASLYAHDWGMAVSKKNKNRSDLLGRKYPTFSLRFFRTSRRIC